MSKSYTPGLKILRNTRIVKERKLPLKGKVKASIGDKLKSTDIVASTSLPGNIHMINIVNQLNIDPSAIQDFVKVAIDQEVGKGEVLAENNGFFGLFKSILILKIVIILISNLPVQNQLVDSANNSYVEKNINFDGNSFFTSFKNLLPNEIDDQ